MATGVKIAVNQVVYNLVCRAIEFDVIPFCQDNGIGITCYSPLMQGLLTGKYTTAESFPANRGRTRHFSNDRSKSRHGEAGHEALLF